MPDDTSGDLVERLKNAARTGQLLDPAPGIADKDIHPEHGDSWSAERQVPAELLRAVLLDPDLRPTLTACG